MSEVFAERIPAIVVAQPPDRIRLDMDVETAQILRLVLCQVADCTEEGRKVGLVWSAIHSVVARDIRLVAEPGVSNKIVIRNKLKRTWRDDR